ncbi:hypothetical protein AGDE_14005 [Angomonas deanei]|nr:hypothetical protein AGDE_14005 [Angomonas deanei]|eukprot:EPY21536.1 hypothetical protein AGDE_14005 [Angomonas deanei]
MWQQLENNCIQERLKKCNETISYIAGGDREVTAASEFPRVALCLGGGSSWTTCFSCVGFLDGLSAPIQTPTFQAKERGMGIKLLDAVCMYAASSACACVCGAGMVSRSMGKDCFHHGVERGEDDGTDAQYVSLFPGGSGAFEKGTAESANFIEEQKARLKEFGTERPMKDRFPWVYGREHFFREDRDAYNGLVHKFSQHNLMRCANVDQLSPKISAVLSTIAPNCFGVPSALINEHLGDTTLTRWCNFIANLFIKPDAHQPLNDYEVDNAVIKERVEEGNMPFPILTASDVGEKDTLEYSSGLCEFSPFYIRRNSVVDGVRQDETYEVKLGGCEEDYVVVVDKRAEVGLLPDNEKQPTSYGRFAWKHMLGACCSELPVHLINFEQQHLSYLASQAKRDVRNPHERGLPTLEELDPTAHHRCGTMTIGVRREGIRCSTLRMSATFPCQSGDPAPVTVSVILRSSV